MGSREANGEKGEGVGCERGGGEAGDGHMHAVWMLVTEFTTPFTNLRWWLDNEVSRGGARLGVDGEEGSGWCRGGGEAGYGHMHAVFPLDAGP